MKSFIGFASECHCHWVCVECAPRLPSSKKSYRSDVQRNIFQMCLQIQKGWTLSYRILNVCGSSGCNWWIRFGSIGFGPIWGQKCKSDDFWFNMASLRVRPHPITTDIMSITFSDRPYVFWVAYANYLPIVFFSGACFLVCIFFVFIYLFLGGASSYMTEETVLCIQCLLITVLCLILILRSPEAS